ncbi:MAG: AI-2E family transporter [Alistipes sp.]|jgi:predicted PurR-regulated permease PerM|nr:AI-2E family transporter [Alistipes sp.]
MIDTIRKNNAIFRQVLFLGILILMGAVMLHQLSFFVGSVLGAIAFYIVFRGPIFTMVERHRWPAWLAAMVIVSAICVVLLGLGYLLFEMLAGEINNVDVSQLPMMAQEVVPKINGFFGAEIVSVDLVRSSTSLLAKVANSIINTTYSFAVNIFMTLIILFFMLANARRFENHIGKYMPFRGENRHVLLDEVTSIIYSNAVGIPLMMLVQGLIAALVYWLFGLPNVGFWAFMTALCGLIPMVGTIIVSVPLGVWFIADGELWKGVLLVLCGVLVIANIDNLTRIVLNKKISNTHPLIIIFGVILGIPLFGFWGIIFGPLMISVFLLLIRIYYKEYKLLDTADRRKDVLPK